MYYDLNRKAPRSLLISLFHGKKSAKAHVAVNWHMWHSFRFLFELNYIRNLTKTNINLRIFGDYCIIYVYLGVQFGGISVKIGIIEDNATTNHAIAAELSDCLHETGFQDIVEIISFYSGEEFLEDYSPGEYDLVLLDILLSEITGIDVARVIRSHYDTVMIVFITASNDYASQSYEVKASHYLQKPVSKDDIRTMLSDIEFSKFKSRRTITLPDGTKLLLSEIVYTDRIKHYAYFYLADSSAKSVRMTQNDVMSLLLPDPDFISVGQGTIVNLAYVKEISKGTMTLSDGTTIHIPKRRYKEIKEYYARHCFESSIKEVMH